MKLIFHSDVVKTFLSCTLISFKEDCLYFGSLKLTVWKNQMN